MRLWRITLLLKDNLKHILDKLQESEVNDVDIVSARLQLLTDNYIKELQSATSDLVLYGSRRVVRKVGKEL